MISSFRRETLRALVTKQVADALQGDLDGGETLMKEAWEHARNDEELEAMQDDLRSFIALIKKGG